MFFTFLILIFPYDLRVYKGQNVHCTYCITIFCHYIGFKFENILKITKKCVPVTQLQCIKIKIDTNLKYNIFYLLHSYYFIIGIKKRNA